jgi:hypothetical protein
MKVLATSRLVNLWAHGIRKCWRVLQASIVYRWLCRKGCICEFAFEKRVLGVLSWRGLTGGRAVANTIPPSAATPTAATAGRKAPQSRKASSK